MKKNGQLNTSPILSATTGITVRFSEVDSLRVVWHGHYIKYFEDAREAFGVQYGLGYLDVFSHGFVTPIVRSICEHKSPIHYGDIVEVEARYIDTQAAKLVFHYTVHNKSTGKIAATGETVQVFLDNNNELMLTLPEFLIAWKQRWAIRNNQETRKEEQQA
ncbi:MAG: acyl-CoA thioesterase [Saprospiraceae bacterium]|nr:acyl-CoA thioesterase [Saprospiraceae bacterium]